MYVHMYMYMSDLLWHVPILGIHVHVHIELTESMA